MEQRSIANIYDDLYPIFHQQNSSKVFSGLNLIDLKIDEENSTPLLNAEFGKSLIL